MTADSHKGRITPSRRVLRHLTTHRGIGIAGGVVLIGAALLLLLMDSSGIWLYQQDEFLVILLFAAVLVAVGEIGFYLGRRERELAGTDVGTHVNEIGTAMFAIVGLLLAFTVAMAVSRFDARKQALVVETSAIRTTYLRAQLLPEPERSAEIGLLRHYTDARLASASPTWYLNEPLKRRTTDLQQQMWAQAVAASAQDSHSISTGLFVQALNDMIEAQGARDAARLNVLPGTVLYLLSATSVLATSILGYRAGLARTRSVLGNVMLALLIAVVILIILDLDRPYRGFITISQQELIQLRQSMGP